MTELKDNFGRIHNYLRLSLTDICNLNCIYCNPHKVNGVKTISEPLLVQEQLRIVNLFAKFFGFDKIRLTGGEPLASKSVLQFLDGVKILKKQHGFQIHLTTNGILLKKYLQELKETGINGINISLDSLDRGTFKKITGHDSLSNVLEAIRESYEMGFDMIKINCVVIRGVNDGELTNFIEYFGNCNVTVRFIEYMPFAENGWNNGSFIGSDEMILELSKKYDIQRIKQSVATVSSDYIIEGKNCKTGFISSISNHFCKDCNRLRVTSAGKLRLCLFGGPETELDLINLLRNPEFTDVEIAELIAEHLHQKADKHPPVEQLVKMDLNYMLKAGG